MPSWSRVLARREFEVSGDDERRNTATQHPLRGVVGV
jgi:hypothetical protein